jgi:hypothetical protein
MIYIATVGRATGPSHAATASPHSAAASSLATLARDPRCFRPADQSTAQ